MMVAALLLLLVTAALGCDQILFEERFDDVSSWSDSNINGTGGRSRTACNGTKVSGQLSFDQHLLRSRSRALTMMLNAACRPASQRLVASAAIVVHNHLLDTTLRHGYTGAREHWCEELLPFLPAFLAFLACLPFHACLDFHRFRHDGTASCHNLTILLFVLSCRLERLAMGLGTQLRPWVCRRLCAH